MSANFSGAPTQVISDFESTMGVTLKFGDTTVTPLTSVVILLATAAVFYTLALLSISKKQK
jgi:multidrug/hemolysin transport system permease protein